jgi:hypothetical protein
MDKYCWIMGVVLEEFMNPNWQHYLRTCGGLQQTFLSRKRAGWL